MSKRIDALEKRIKILEDMIKPSNKQLIAQETQSSTWLIETARETRQECKPLIEWLRDK